MRPVPQNFLCKLAVKAALGMTLFLSLALAHDLNLPRPTPEQMAQVQPMRPGATEFATELLAHYRNQFNPQQLVVLDRVAGSLTAVEQLRSGAAHHLTAPETVLYQSFYQWQADAALLELMDLQTNALAFDLRQAPCKPSLATELDQQFNQLLLKVFTGDGAPAFRVQEMSLVSERAPEMYTVNVASNATTWVLLKLSQVPSDETTLHVSFRPDGAREATSRGAIAVRSRPLGQLGLEVLDETGQPTPVLLRLTAHASQRLFEPAGAVDLAPLMNEITSLSIYGPGRGYMIYVPGKFSGRYWVVAKPFAMAVPVGEWEVHVLHGLEYEPVHETFRVEPGQWTRKTIHLKRWTNLPVRGWYSGDDHVHARMMSADDAEKLMAATRAADIHVSNILEMGNEMRTWYVQRGFGPDFRVQEGNHWLVPGQEDPRSMLGHAIGLNLRSKVRDLDRYYLNDWIAEQIHAQGGLYGHTHVGNSEVKSLFTERQMALFTPMGIVDFNSILQNKLGVDLFYDYLNLGFQMTATAGSDTPYGGTVGSVRLYAYCGEGKFTPDRWFEAIKAGHTFVTTGPMLEFRVEDALPGDTITVEEDRKLQVKIRASGLRGASAPVALRLIQFGKAIKEVFPTRPGQDELELTAQVPAGYGGWLAAHAVGQDRSEAHTTPVYVVRKGFRFWDVNQAEALIQKQLTILNEIDQAITGAEAAVKAGNQPLDYWNAVPARQADQIRVRVHRVRQMYRDLQTTVATERTSRRAANQSALQKP
jgi:hypothetical protein